MKKLFLLVLVIPFALAACSAPAANTPVETQAAAATQPPQATAAQPSTTPQATVATVEEQPTTAAASGGVVVYKIVSGESQLKYEVGEVFLNQSNRYNLAVGITSVVNGEISIDSSAPQNSQIGEISADISQFKSDSNRRDNAIRGRFLESEQYPMVTFIATQVNGLPEAYQEGQQLALTISGDLTIRETTRPVQFDALVKLEGGVLSGEAVTTILMSEFGFGPISIGGVLNTEDQAKVTLTFIAKP